MRKKLFLAVLLVLASCSTPVPTVQPKEKLLIIQPYTDDECRGLHNCQIET